MASKLTFGQLLRYFRARGVDRERGRKLTQERLGELIGAKLGIESGLKGATISGWELGDKRPYSDDRSILIALVQTLYECEGIRAIEEANQLLEAGDYRALNDDEITHCGFPSSPSLPAPIPEPSSEESCTWTWQAGLWLAFLALDLIGLAGLCYLLLSGVSLLARDVALVAIGALLALAGVLEIPARGEHFCALGKALYEWSPLRFGVIALLPVILILWVTVGRNVYCQVYPCGEHIVLVETFDGRDLEHDDVDEAIGLTEARLRQLLRRTQSLHVMNEVDDFTASQIDFRIMGYHEGKGNLRLVVDLTDGLDHPLTDAIEVSGDVLDRKDVEALQKELGRRLLEAMGVSAADSHAALKSAFALHLEALAANQEGVAFYQQGRLAQAESRFREALQAEPDYVEALINLGVLYAAEGCYDEAEARLQQALIFEPKSPYTHYNLGGVYSAQQDWVVAIKAYRQAIRFFPNYVQAFNNLGHAYLELGRLRQARSTLEKGLVLAPGAFYLHKNLGRLALVEGDALVAIAELKQALEGNPAYPEAQFYLAKAYALAGERTAACRALVAYNAFNDSPDSHQEEIQQLWQELNCSEEEGS